MNVPSTGVTAAVLKDTGTPMTISVPESATETPATLSVHALLLSGGVEDLTGTPSMGPSQPVPVLSIRSIPFEMRLYSIKQEPCAWNETTFGVGKNSIYP